MFNKATEYIDKVIKEKKLPLLDVLVYKDHELLYRHSGSYTGKHGEEDILSMYSCTKVLTAVSGMRLVEEGKIALNDPVGKYLPAFENAYTVDEDGNKHKEVITVKHLFTMSSGLDYNLNRPLLIKFAKENYENATTAEVLSILPKYPLHFTPGKRFLYSLSHDVLGAVIEVVEGMSLADYMQKYIFEPLGMKDSTMKSEGYIKNPPQCYEILDDLSFIPEKGNTYKHFHPTKNYASGGAGLISTALDYSIFADTLASGGKSKSGYQLIKPESIEMMKELAFDCMDINSTYTCAQGPDYGYALGVRIRKVKNEYGIPKGEFGWDGAAGSYTLIDTDNNISITMGMNILAWPKAFSGDHLAIANLIYEELI
ncbi:MAG: beta-lactamase family protein [Clostridia bacterium]|nr:beta-lactamase family protein [Clostridia bacterium]